MNISLAKALLGTLSVGASGLGIYGVYSLTSSTPSKTVRQVLQEDSKIILLKVDDSEDDSEWATKVTDLGNNDASPILEGYSKDAEDKKEQVKKICKTLFESSSKEDSKLRQAKKWCTKAAPTAGA